MFANYAFGGKTDDLKGCLYYNSSCLLSFPFSPFLGEFKKGRNGRDLHFPSSTYCEWVGGLGYILGGRFC